jgi:hypothetical protein
MEPTQETESVIRAVTVALLLNDPSTAFEFLQRAAAVREDSKGVQRVTQAPPLTSPINFHAAMRAVHASRRRAMEASVLKDFAETLLRSVESTS